MQGSRASFSECFEGEKGHRTPALSREATLYMQKDAEDLWLAGEQNLIQVHMSTSNGEGIQR